jgi:hypothetical protein
MLLAVYIKMNRSQLRRATSETATWAIAKPKPRRVIEHKLRINRRLIALIDAPAAMSVGLETDDNGGVFSNELDIA